MRTNLHSYSTTRIKLAGATVTRHEVKTAKVGYFEHKDGKSLLNNKSKGALKLEHKLEQLEHEFKAKVREYDIQAKRSERTAKIEAIMKAKGKR